LLKSLEFIFIWFLRNFNLKNCCHFQGILCLVFSFPGFCAASHYQVTTIKWFCGHNNFIVIKFVFVNNMLGLILYIYIYNQIYYLKYFFQKIKLCRCYYMSFCFIHIFYLFKKFVRQNVDYLIVLFIIFSMICWCSHNEYFIFYFTFKFDIFYLSKVAWWIILRKYNFHYYLIH